MILGIALLAGAALLVLLWVIRAGGKPTRVTGLPEGEIVYSGISGHGVKLLHAHRFHLSGKPDYVVKRGTEFLSVEVKSGATPRELYDSDRMQVVAQALLVEEEFGQRPKVGYVRYADKTFKVKISPKSVEKVEKAIAVMREARATATIPDAYPAWYLCPTCKRTSCPKRVKKGK